jgi:D-alanyl-D-alanine dipeptidase
MDVFEHAKSRLGQDFISLERLEIVVIDLKYNGTENFMNQDLYSGFNQAYLHAHAYQKFLKACEFLKQIKPGWKFIIFDALRPRNVQRKMYDFVKDTPYRDYVADPEKGSMHNFGMALDLSLLDENGDAVDMGTLFDDFSEKAQPKLEQALLKQKKLTQDQVDNRWILRSAMEFGGFIQLPHEWWHYNALDPDQVRGHFAIVE